MNHQLDHPPPEKERRGLERQSHFPGDFLNNQVLTKYKPAEEKSISTTSEPALIDFWPLEAPQGRRESEISEMGRQRASFGNSPGPRRWLKQQPKEIPLK
jgi:hypothetical protein